VPPSPPEIGDKLSSFLGKASELDWFLEPASLKNSLKGMVTSRIHRKRRGKRKFFDGRAKKLLRGELLPMLSPIPHMKLGNSLDRRKFSR
jgi:hypothetical protein